MTDLKPCPHCGEYGHAIVSFNDVFWVECGSCDAQGPRIITEKSAVEAWNTRHTTKAQIDAATRAINEAFMAKGVIDYMPNNLPSNELYYRGSLSERCLAKAALKAAQDV